MVDRSAPIPTVRQVNTPRSPRAIIVDPHPVVAAGLSAILSGAGTDVVASYATPAELLAAWRPCSADVVIVDPADTASDTLDLVRHLVAQTPAPAVIVFTADTQRALVTEAISAGAAGFHHKTATPDTIVAAVSAAARGERTLDVASTDALVDSLLNPNAGGDPTTLSRREREVLALVAEGCTNAQIGERLFIGSQTVKTHLARTFRKLGVRDRAQATAVAIRDHLI